MSARVADGRDGVNLQNENVTTATHTCVPQPRMGLLSFSCAQLGRVLARYEGGHASEHGLYVALVFLTVASAANVIGAGALWAIPTHSFWRAVAAFLVIVIAGAVVTSYFIVSGRRDSMALGAYGRTHDELVRNARKCRLVLPDKRLSLRDPGNSAPWQDLLVVFFCVASTIVALRAACELSPVYEPAEERSQGRRKTVASLRSIDADTPHSIRERCCAVCLEPMTEGALSVLPCAHGFHENCIGAWIAVARKGHCPVCMTSVVGALRQTGQPLREQPRSDGETQV